MTTKSERLKYVEEHIQNVNKIALEGINQVGAHSLILAGQSLILRLLTDILSEVKPVTGIDQILEIVKNLGEPTTNTGYNRMLMTEIQTLLKEKGWLP